MVRPVGGRLMAIYRCAAEALPESHIEAAVWDPNLAGKKPGSL